MVGVLAAAVVALGFQFIVLRRLRHAAAIVRVISTIGLLGLTQAVLEKRYGSANQPVEQYLPERDVRHRRRPGPGGAPLHRRHLGARHRRCCGPGRKYTRVGLAINASAQNERAVQTLGWSPDRLAALTWGLGGGLAGLAAVLLAPLSGLSITTFTIVATVTGLGAALLGGFHSFPMTFVGGLVIGLERVDGHRATRATSRTSSART